MARYGEPNAMGTGLTAATAAGAATAAAGGAYAWNKSSALRDRKQTAAAAEREFSAKSRSYKGAEARVKAENPNYKPRKNGAPDKRTNAGKTLAADYEAKSSAKGAMNAAKTEVAATRGKMLRGAKVAVGGAAVAGAAGGLNEYLRARRIRQDRERLAQSTQQAMESIRARNGGN